MAGHICLDITPVFPETFRGEIHQLVVPGKLINVENAQIHVGGAVANTGLAMAFFGSDVQLMSKVGQDKFGENVIRCNADIRVGKIRQFCKLPEDGQSLMRAAMSQLNLSARCISAA